MIPRARALAAAAALLFAAACGSGAPPPPGSTAPPATRPSILLVTLDTTRADAIGPDARGIRTPAFNALAARGRRFRHAYATVPETLPSHASMMTGLYPAGHGIHENGRDLSDRHVVIADELRQSGYRTAAFVSSFVLARRFGLARGFDTYDDELPAGRAERTARETTERAMAYLSQPSDRPLFVWVHYFDPHAPYEPPEPFRREHADRPYLGEVAAMDHELGRLVQAFEQRAGANAAVVVAGDHGEGLGDRGESQHGNLLYQSTMHVPVVLAGPGIAAGAIDVPVSTRRIFHTLRDWGGIPTEHSLRAAAEGGEVVIGEAMKPFLSYGWQPQIMAIEPAAAPRKAIFAGRTEVFDLAGDPGETRDIGAGGNVPAPLRKVLDEYPVPSPEAARQPDSLTDEARRSLASLGYVGSTAAPVIRKDAPRPADKVALFDVIERASALFVGEQYAQAIPLFQRILAEDPYNLDAALRLATAYSSLGQDARAMEAFRRAAAIAPRSPDVRVYTALHYARGAEWRRAVPLLEQAYAEAPNRLPVVEALAAVREREGRLSEALTLRQAVHRLRAPTAADLLQLGTLAMQARDTALAITSFEQARAMQGAAFRQNLELGVLYLAARRFEDAKTTLDRVLPTHPEYPMALFKRAQISVLLNEPDKAERIAAARRRADATTRRLIENEALFRRN